MIRVESVIKRFGTLTAVNDVSFELQRDELVGFVGPNGAGKSTMLKMLATYLYPTSGRLSIGGLDVVDDALAVQRKLGYLPGDTPLYQEMRVDRFLHFIGRARGLDGPRLRARMEWVVEACALQQALGQRVKECSTGYRKRIGLAAALIHDPEVVLLDEPTHGLDPLQVISFRLLLRELRPGRVILLSSHIISEVEAICDRLLIIHAGHLLGDGTVTSIRAAADVPGHDLEELFIELIRRYESRREGQRARRGGRDA